MRADRAVQTVQGRLACPPAQDAAASLPSELQRHHCQAVAAYSEAETAKEKAEVRAGWQKELWDAVIVSGH